eukprot:CAMPEP_0115231386 /NCGR_PEP_ID=MMETSP0270-20121206/33211_1 /TAXON_ID=71861 /ORGANISM="Scrippsiella trochoidea, Strain CCMP3099" /LENGTH=488 /DNA_ID=CAMNT_0002646021 /DNA_START=113 /DNA_END=1579 /DNA_ORIENTATION=+
MTPPRGQSSQPGCSKASTAVATVSDLGDDLSTRYEPSPSPSFVGRRPAAPSSSIGEDECSVASSDSLASPLLPPSKPAIEQPAQAAVYRSSALVVAPVFAAYACLFSLQHEVKVVYGIADDDSPASHDFSFATSSLFAFKLVFRFLHSIVFGCLAPRGRLYVGMGALATAMGLLAAVTAGVFQPLPRYVFMAYALGGTGVGSFEGNVLASFTFLGPETKKFAVMGMPIGVSSVTIGAFLLRYLGVPVAVIYVSMIVLLAASAAALRLAIPREPAGAAEGLLALPGAAPAAERSHRAIWKGRSVVMGLREWTEWTPGMWSRCLASLADMAILEVFSPGLLLFVYNTPRLSLLAPPVWLETVSVPKDLFFVFYDLCTAAGSLVGRYTAYRIQRLVHPAWFVILMIVGAALIIVSTPGHYLGAFGLLLAPLGGFVVLLGDGLVYVMVCRFIDEHVPKAYSTAALSCWLFTADLGSNIGANMIAYLRDWVSA